jgi:hypothetical protein
MKQGRDHGVVNTPVARRILIARGTAYSNRFPVSGGGGLPQTGAGAATTLDFSRPAQRSLAGTACQLAASPKASHLSRRLRRFRFLHRRSDSYRLERPSCRARFSLAEDQTPLHGAPLFPSPVSALRLFQRYCSQPGLDDLPDKYRTVLTGGRDKTRIRAEGQA